MKKGIALFLAAVLTAALLSGCGKSSSQSTASGSSESLSESSSASEVEGDFVRGTWSNTAYTNDYLKLCFTLPEGWVAATDEEIANTMNLGTDLLTEEQKFTADLAKQKTIYEMMAAQKGGGPNLVLMLENLSMTIGGTSYDEQAYADVVSEQLGQLDSMTVKLLSTTQQEMAGYTFLRQDYDVNDGQMTMTYFFLRYNQYMLVMTFTGVPEIAPSSEEIASYFSAQA